MSKGYYFLASPYSHPDPNIQTQRYVEACQAAHWLIAKRIWVFSPIVHCRTIDVSFGLPHDHKFWEEYSDTMIRGAKGLLVLQIDGVGDSVGVKGEIALAHQLNLPIMDLRRTPIPIMDLTTMGAYSLSQRSSQNDHRY